MEGNLIFLIVKYQEKKKPSEICNLLRVKVLINTLKH